jgi:hypothetical protein
MDCGRCELKQAFFIRIGIALVVSSVAVSAPHAQQPPPLKPKPSPTQPKPAPLKPKGPKQYRGFISVNGGIQWAADTLSDQFTYDLHAETATTSVDYDLKGAPLLDVAAGWRFWKTTGIAVGLSYSSGKSGAQTESEIPHPFFDDQHRLVSGQADNLHRIETDVHVQLFWVREHRKWRTRVLGGLTYFTVKQDIVTGINVVETYPYDTAEFHSASRERTSGSGAGFNVGVDVAHMLTPQFGLGGAARYTRGTTDLNVSGGRSVSTDAGGIQATAGVRIAF